MKTLGFGELHIAWS